MFKKSSQDFLARDFVRGMKLQGMADDDIVDVLEKAGMPNEMAISMLGRVKEAIDLQGVKDRKTLIREEVESAMWEGQQELHNELKQIEDKIEYLQLLWENETETLRYELQKINTFIKSFEMFLKNYESNIPNKK
jgi:hypothetical protein